MSPDQEIPPAGSENAADAASAPPASGIKVELDVEDAPFLEDDEAPKEAEAAGPASAPEKEDASAPLAMESEKKGFFADKKRLIVLGVVGAFILLAIPVGYLLFGGKKAPPPKPVEPTRIVTPSVPPREDAPAGAKFLFQVDPFFLERRGAEGEIRFLRCRFSIPTDNAALFGELKAKNIAVRDAIYYYLNNGPLVFLSSPEADILLKTDLISVINELLSAGKIQELFIEEYLVSGR
jgi:flagellar FliL protein